MRLGLLSLALPLVAAVAVGACAPVRAAPAPSGGEAAQPATKRTLTIVIRVEPFDLTDHASGRTTITRSMFTATLAKIDGQGVARPVLLQSLPELNTSDWRLSPDGRMETTYRLKPNLTWHDGTPFSAEDVVFTNRANTARLEGGVSVSALTGLDYQEHVLVEDIRALDSRTVVVRWKQPFPQAGTPGMRPTAKHILEPVMNPSQPELFGSSRYWTTEYVGLGPYRLVRWEAGAFIEGIAFEGYALGRPRIDRVTVTWSGDPNVVMARLLSGDTDIALDESIQLDQGITLRREWVSRGAGVVQTSPGSFRFMNAQHRPEYARPKAVHDVRVRKALLHAIDRRALVDAVLAGEGIVAETVAPPTVHYHPAVERVVPKYPFDPRRTEQLMAEAGFSQGADGFYVSPTEGRFDPEVMGVAESQEAKEATIAVDFFRQAGIDGQLRLVPSAQLIQSDEIKATFPALRANYQGTPEDMSASRYTASQVARPENRWSGSNKSGWVNDQHDRLFRAWNSSLDRGERDQIIVEIIKLYNEELPYLPLYFSVSVRPYVASLQGPQRGALGSTPYENLHEWHWR